MWGSKFCFAAFGCIQALIIQRYTARLIDISYNQYFAGVGGGGGGGGGSETKAIVNQLCTS